MAMLFARGGAREKIQFLAKIIYLEFLATGNPAALPA